MALFSIPPNKFVLPSYLYYRLCDIEKNDYRVDPNGITSIPIFNKIHPAVLELNYADGQIWPALYAFTSCTSYRKLIKLGLK